MNKSKEDFLIIVADDIRSMRKLLVRILEMNGFTNIKEAGNGGQAIEMIQQEQPDLVITDWHMPGIDGIGVLESLRSNTQTRSTPFIMLSCDATVNSVETALQAGANDYIDKPFEREEVIKKVKNLLKISDLSISEI